MKKIYSKIDSNKLLHIIYRLSEDIEFRNNITPPEEYLQVAAIKMEKGKTFKAHKHIFQERVTDIAQESWVVIKGKVMAVLYDLDDKVIDTPILNEGDCSITFRGGHTYECLEDDTVVYEYKTGPYQGVEKDKVFLEE
jgi:cupin fold WbuC family metalloprotein